MVSFFCMVCIAVGVGLFAAPTRCRTCRRAGLTTPQPSTWGTVPLCLSASPAAPSLPAWPCAQTLPKPHRSPVVVKREWSLGGPARPRRRLCSRQAACVRVCVCAGLPSLSLPIHSADSLGHSGGPCPPKRHHTCCYPQDVACPRCSRQSVNVAPEGAGRLGLDVFWSSCLS